MPPSSHLPLLDKTLGLQLIAAGASISMTAKLLRVTETTARQFRRTIASAAAEGLRPGEAVRQTFVAAYGVDDEQAWQAARAAASTLLLERVGELPAGRGRPADLGEIVDAMMAEGA